MISGTLQSVSTLLITVGLSNKPLVVGKGGFTRGNHACLDRFKQRGLLAADISACADAGFQCQMKISNYLYRSQDSLHFWLHRALFPEQAQYMDIPADVNITFACADSIGCNAHAFNGAVRVVQQEDAILERTRFGFVRVADDVFLIRLRLCRALPFDSRWERRPAASHQTRGLDLRYHLFGFHLQGFEETLITSILRYGGGFIATICGQPADRAIYSGYRPKNLICAQMHA